MKITRQIAIVGRASNGRDELDVSVFGICSPADASVSYGRSPRIVMLRAPGDRSMTVYSTTQGDSGLMHRNTVTVASCKSE